MRVVYYFIKSNHVIAKFKINYSMWIFIFINEYLAILNKIKIQLNFYLFWIYYE
jgi:hypothetical protein